MAYAMKHKRIWVDLPFLPIEKMLEKGGFSVTVSHFNPDSDPDAPAVVDALYRMFEFVVDEGMSYPQTEAEISCLEDFESYWMARDVFLCRRTEDGKVIASFYVKPNFPGRSSHICNAGFMVHKDFRRLGLLRLLTPVFLRAAKELGFAASFFNLVFASNAGALKIYREFGFREIGVIPSAGRLKDGSVVDAVQFYYDLSTYEVEADGDKKASS